MLYLISVFWFWLLLALVLGLLVGWMMSTRAGKVRQAGKTPSAGTVLAIETHDWAGLAPWGVALAIGALVAWSQILPRSVGYWFDLAMVMLAAYCVGCLLSALLFAGRSVTQDNLAQPRPVAAIVAVSTAPARETAVEPAGAGAVASVREASEEAIVGLSGPRGASGDDLTKIYGIDQETQKKINGLGIYHYDQVASLTPGNRRWLFRQLGYAGRFPSWWWRWRYDAEQILAGKSPAAKSPAAKTPAGMEAPTGTQGEVKPAGLSAPRDGKFDDLKRIRGIGKQNEGRLHGLGIWHFDQIAAWSPGEVRWVGAYLAFPGRIEREDWVAQAGLLAKGGETEFSKRADAGKVATSRDNAGDDGRGNVAEPGPLSQGGAGGAAKPASKKPQAPGRAK